MRTARTIRLSCTVFFFCLAGNTLAQQGVLYKLKYNGNYITKAQADSMSKVHSGRMKMAYMRDGDKRIVEIDTLSAGETPGQSGMQMSMSWSTGTQGGSTSSTASKSFKDEKGQPLTEEDFKAKIRLGEFSTRYEMEKNNDKYNVTYHLVPKTEADKKRTESINEFRDKVVNSKLPDFELPLADGKLINATSLLGKTVIFNFWFINCRPCVLEMPSLNEVVEKYKGRADIVFLAPSLDNRDKILKFLESTKFSYKQIPDAEKLSQQFGLSAYPTHLVVNSKGIIVEAIVGSSENIGAKLIDAIEKTIKQ